MTVSIEQVIAAIPEWRGRPTAIHPMTGGLTNTNYRVDVDGTAYFVRLPGASTELLAVDRRNEYHNTLMAAEAGVGPRVVHHLTEHHVMVLEFIEGDTMTIPSMQAAGMPSRAAHSIQLLHAAGRFLTDFNMFRLVEFYLKIVGDHAVRIPDDYRKHLPLVAEMEAAIMVQPLATVPCNNDLLPANYIDDGCLLRLIDFEYSGNNDPCFELGNSCQELEYNENQYAELCSAYFGEARPALLARMHLFAIMSDVGWTLWGAIQGKISKLDFDFWGYAVGRWERALGMINSEPFPRWLEAVQRAS